MRVYLPETKGMAEVSTKGQVLCEVLSFPQAADRFFRKSKGQEELPLLRISPLFIFLFVAAAVLTAFGIHRYMRQAQQQASGSSSFSSFSPPSPATGEAIEDIPGEWTRKKSADEEVMCQSWSPDGICLSEAEEE